MVHDRRRPPALPLPVSLALSVYLLSALSDGVSVVLDGSRGFDVLALVLMASGSLVLLRNALPALEDVLSWRRADAPMASAALVTFAMLSLATTLWSIDVREAEPVNHELALLCTVAAAALAAAFGHLHALRRTRQVSRERVELSSTQRIARASLKL